MKNEFKNPFAYIVLILGLIITTTPMMYLVGTSFKSNITLYDYPPKLFPSLKDLSLANYVEILIKESFYRNLLNSMMVTVLTVILAALISSAMAYCIARYSFPGKNLLFSIIMATMIIPGLALIVPQYELASWLHITRKLFGLVPVYVAWVIPFSTFMIKGFVENIPRDFDDAVNIDGGNVFTIYRIIIVPLASPAIASVSIFNFLSAWEEFPWAMLTITEASKRTFPSAIVQYFGAHNFTQWGYVFAMSVVSLVPILIFFIALQKYFIQGLSAGAIKG